MTHGQAFEQYLPNNYSNYQTFYFPHNLIHHMSEINFLIHLHFVLFLLVNEQFPEFYEV